MIHVYSCYEIMIFCYSLGKTSCRPWKKGAQRWSKMGVQDGTCIKISRFDILIVCENFRKLFLFHPLHTALLLDVHFIQLFCDCLTQLYCTVCWIYNTWIYYTHLYYIFFCNFCNLPKILRKVDNKRNKDSIIYSLIFRFLMKISTFNYPQTSVLMASARRERIRWNLKP